MAKIRVSKQFQAPIEKVFGVLSDIPNSEKVVSGITNVEMLTDQPVGIGTRWRETRVMFGREATEEMEITEFEPHDKYVVEAESCGAHFRTEFRFQVQGAQTHVDMELTTRPITFFAKLMSPLSGLLSGSLVKALEKDLEDCRKAIEAAESTDNHANN